MQPCSGRVISLHNCSTYELLGDPFKVLLQDCDTQSNLSLLHAYVEPQSGSPPHLHRTFEEMYYLFQGELQITLGAHRELIQAGTLVYIPKAISHSYYNPSHNRAQLLIWAIPAGIEAFVMELSTALTQGTQPETEVDQSQFIQQQIRAIAAQHDFIPVSESQVH